MIRRRHPIWLAGLLALVLVAGLAEAQEPVADEPVDEEPAGDSDLPFDDLLGEDELLRPEGYTYERWSEEHLAESHVRCHRSIGQGPEGDDHISAECES